MQFHGDGRFPLGAFLRRVLEHKKDTLAQGNDETAGGGFQAVQGVAVIHVRHLETETRSSLIIIVEQTIQAEGFGDFFEQRFGIAVQVEVLPSHLRL